MKYLVCFDMDRVLVDHMSTWQYVYDKLEISNHEAFELYNQGKLDECCLLYTSPSPRDFQVSRMPSSA